MSRAAFAADLFAWADVHLPPGAVLVGGEVRDAVSGERYLRRADLALALGVRPSKISTWATRYPRGHATPWPGHDPNVRADVGAVMLLRPSVCQAWRAERARRRVAASRANAERARAVLAARRAGTTRSEIQEVAG